MVVGTLDPVLVDPLHAAAVRQVIRGLSSAAKQLGTGQRNQPRRVNHQRLAVYGSLTINSQSPSASGGCTRATVKASKEASPLDARILITRSTCSISLSFSSSPTKYREAGKGGQIGCGI